MQDIKLSGSPAGEKSSSILPAVLLLVVLVGAVAGAVFQSAKALEQREVESAAVALELSTHTIFMIERIPQPLTEGLAEENRVAIQLLETELEPGLLSLNQSSAEETRRLRDDLVESARSNSTEPSAAAGPLMANLGEAGDRANDIAQTAETRALWLIVLAVIAGSGAAVLLFGSRRRERSLRGALAHQATTDQLTGLQNRRMIDEQLGHARSEMERSNCLAGLLYLDLDGFKTINDTLGHDAGDEMLRLTAQRLADAAAPGESLLRLGGDEFAVFLSGLQTPEHAVAAAQRYLSILEEPSEVMGRVEFMRASIGVACTDDPSALRGLTAEADLAMYEAKRSGGRAIQVFNESLRKRAERTSEVTRALRAADHDDEFHLVYQPVVGVDSRELLFVEALLRWESPELGPVGPVDFIPVAEASGDIGVLGGWVITEVLDQLVRWDSDPEMNGARASCNVSAVQLVEQRFVERVISQLHERQLSPDRLIIEVTESVALDESGVCARAITELHEAGFSIAIDDFGAGYANLSQLFKVPFDILKLDRDLLLQLTAMVEEQGSEIAIHSEIMASINEIAAELGAAVVCEGVETEEQRRSLERSGVEYIQGWLIGRPARAETFESKRFLEAA